MTARDIRYGRQGGRIVAWDRPPLDVDAAPRCGICGRPMLLGQNVRHWTCGPVCPGCHLWLSLCSCSSRCHDAHRQIMRWSRT